MNARKFIVLKENHKGETQELKKYYQTKKQAQTDVKLLNQRAKVTQSGNIYTLKRRINK